VTEVLKLSAFLGNFCQCIICYWNYSANFPPIGRFTINNTSKEY